MGPSKTMRTPPVTRNTNRILQSQQSVKNNTNNEFEDLKFPRDSHDIEKSPTGSKKTRNIKMHQKQQDVNIYNSLIDDSDGSDIEILKSTENNKRPKLIPYSQIILDHKLKNPKETMTIIKSWVKGLIHFHISNEKRSILTYNKEDYESVLKNLKELKFEHFTYSPKELKPKKIVLTGLESGYDKEEILEDLNNQLKGSKIEIISLQNIFALVRNHLNKNHTKRDINKFLISFPGKCDMNHITKNVKYVCDHKIRWEPFINKYKSIQCRNCQRFGHSASNCGMIYRCVKCTNPHDVGQCQKKPEDSPQCINCDQKHSANFSKCQALIDFRENLKKHTRKPKDVKLRFSPRVTEDLSYKDAFITDISNFNYNNNSCSNNFPNLASSDNSNFNFLSNEIKLLFNTSLPSLLTNIKNFVPIYKLETDEMSKKVLMLDFLSQYV